MINQDVRVGANDVSETLSSNTSNSKTDKPVSFYLDDKESFYETHKKRIIIGVVCSLFAIIMIIILASGSGDHITPFGPGDKDFKFSKASLNIEYAEFTDTQNSSNIWVEDMAANHNYFFIAEGCANDTKRL